MSSCCSAVTPAWSNFFFQKGLSGTHPIVWIQLYLLNSRHSSGDVVYASAVTCWDLGTSVGEVVGEAVGSGVVGAVDGEAVGLRDGEAVGGFVVGLALGSGRRRQQRPVRGLKLGLPLHGAAALQQRSRLSFGRYAEGKSSGHVACGVGASVALDGGPRRPRPSGALVGAGVGVSVGRCVGAAVGARVLGHS